MNSITRFARTKEGRIVESVALRMNARDRDSCLRTPIPAGASCKTCLHFNSLAAVCRLKSKRVAAYNVCHLHGKEIVK